MNNKDEIHLFKLLKENERLVLDLEAAVEVIKQGLDLVNQLKEQSVTPHQIICLPGEVDTFEEKAAEAINSYNNGMPIW